jgi:hypothetical protein
MLSIHLRLGLPSGLFPSGFLLFYFGANFFKPDRLWQGRLAYFELDLELIVDWSDLDHNEWHPTNVL